MGRGWVWFGLALWVAACGGRSERNEGGDGDGTAAPGGEDDDAANPGGNDDVPGEDVALPGCEPGPRDVGHSGQDCLWLAENRCYYEKLDACACICPREHESICSSGFESEVGRTPVYCY